MRAVIVEVGREIDELVLEVRGRPKEGAIQKFPPDGADQSFDKGMGERDIRYGFYFVDVEDAKIGLPLTKLKQGIMVGTEVHGLVGLSPDGAVEHPAKCGTIDDAGMDAEADDATGELIHEDEDPMGAQGGRFAPEQVNTPEAVLHVSEEGQPGRTGGMVFRSIVVDEDPSNGVFVDGNAESEGDLLSDAGTPPGRVAELHLEDGLNNFLTGSFWTRSAPAWGGEKEAIFSIFQGLMKGQKGRGFEYDRRTDEAGGPNEKRAQTGDQTIGSAKIGCSLPGSIEDEELMFDENGLGDDGTDATGPQEPGEGGKDMDEKDENVAHVGIIAKPGFD